MVAMNEIQALVAALEKREALDQSMLEKIAELRRPVVGQAKQIVESYNRPVNGVDPTGGFKNAGQFLRTIRDIGQTKSFDRDPVMDRWVKSSFDGMNETVDADGGVLVPTEFANRLLQNVWSNDLLARTTLLPVSGKSLEIPAINETSRADGSRFGGIQGYWEGEAAETTVTKPSFHKLKLELNNLTVRCIATEDLLTDAGPVLETWLYTGASGEIQTKIGDALVNGDGVRKPKGMLNSAAKVTADKGSTASGNITATNVMQMWSQLLPQCEANAVWLYHKTAFPALMSMTIGSATVNQAVFVPQGGLSAAPYGTIFGRPAIPCEFCQAVGTEGDLILCDLSQMMTIAKGGINSAVSIHVYFNTSEVAFKFKIRLDSKCWMLNSVAQKNGSPRLSSIVTLQTR